MEVELKPAGGSSSSRKVFGPPIREDLLILADFLAAFPPLAPDRCLSGAGVSPLPPFLFGLCLRYLVVDLTPSTRADSSRTQIYPFFVSSVGDNFSTFLKACSALSNQLKTKYKGLSAYPVHGQIVPDAVLPSFGRWILGFVGVLLKPFIDFFENHGVPSYALQRSVYELCVWFQS